MNRQYLKEKEKTTTNSQQTHGKMLKLIVARGL